MHKCFLVAALLVFGCGQEERAAESSFSGTWIGALTETLTCTDSTKGSAPYVATYRAAGSSTAVTFDSGGQCGVMGANVVGNAALLMPASCVPVTGSGITSTDTILSGTGVLDGETLHVLAAVSTAISGRVTGTCTGFITGDMTRKK